MGLGSLSLRPQLVGIGRCCRTSSRASASPHAVAGLLVTIPVLCMGVFAPTAALLAGRVGTNARGLRRADPGRGRGHRARDHSERRAGAARDGTGGHRHGARQRADAPRGQGRLRVRPLLGTGVYTTGIQLGSFLAAIVAVPIADVWFGWRGALAAFGIAAAAGAIVWVMYAPRGQGSVVDVAGIPRLPVRNVTAWLLVAMFASVAVNYYGLGAWLPNAYQERGWSEGHAALLLAIFNLATVPAGVAVTVLGDRIGSTPHDTGAGRDPPDRRHRPADRGAGRGVRLGVRRRLRQRDDVPAHDDDAARRLRRATDVSAVTGMMLGFGYSIAALSPFVLGAVRDSTGSFTTSLWLLVAITTVLAFVAWQLGPTRLARGVAVEPRVRVGET